MCRPTILCRSHSNVQIPLINMVVINKGHISPLDATLLIPPTSPTKNAPILHYMQRSTDHSRKPWVRKSPQNHSFKNRELFQLGIIISWIKYYVVEFNQKKCWGIIVILWRISVLCLQLRCVIKSMQWRRTERGERKNNNFCFRTIEIKQPQVIFQREKGIKFKVDGRVCGSIGSSRENCG